MDEWPIVFEYSCLLHACLSFGFQVLPCRWTRISRTSSRSGCHAALYRVCVWSLYSIPLHVEAPLVSRHRWLFLHLSPVSYPRPSLLREASRHPCRHRNVDTYQSLLHAGIRNRASIYKPLLRSKIPNICQDHFFSTPALAMAQ